MSPEDHEDMGFQALLTERLVLDDRPGPAARLPKDRALLLIDNALEAWPEAVAAAPNRARWLSSAAVAAIALLVIVGGAAAARWYFASPQPSAAPAPTATTHAASSTQVPPVTPAPQPTPVPIVTDAPSLPTEAAPDSNAELDKPRAEHERPNKAHGISQPSAPREVEDLLQEANDLRASGNFEQAAATYATVYERYPGSLSAYVAQVAAGSIELEHLDRPAQAAALFERAIAARPRGALDIEARQGLALSLRDAGDRKHEINALELLLAAHPQSPAATRARARLHELGIVTP